MHIKIMIMSNRRTHAMSTFRKFLIKRSVVVLYFVTCLCLAVACSIEYPTEEAASAAVAKGLAVQHSHEQLSAIRQSVNAEGSCVWALVPMSESKQGLLVYQAFAGDSQRHKNPGAPPAEVCAMTRYIPEGASGCADWMVGHPKALSKFLNKEARGCLVVLQSSLRGEFGGEQKLTGDEKQFIDDINAFGWEQRVIAGFTAFERQ